jgi:hypothetical protein
MLQLRVATVDECIVEGGFTEHDAKIYLAFSNALLHGSAVWAH